MTSALTSKTSLPTLSAGSLDDFIRSVSRIRLLSAAQEREYAVRWRGDGDVEAARSLVLSHLPLVLSTARGFLGYGLPYADLIQEGTVGLMKAVRHFDPARGVRLASYAVHWVRAAIQEYVLSNWRLVKAAKTKAGRKLFFSLRSVKQHLEWLSEHEIEALSHALDVTPQALRSIEAHLYGSDVSALPAGDQPDNGEVAPRRRELIDDSPDPCGVLEDEQWNTHRHQALRAAIATLAPRDREIIERRWLCEDSLTLRELAERFGITAERVRQLEKRAMRQLACRLHGTVALSA